ncbi:hypothetical protein QBC43DRAFT_307975 [Cladorrhinum sp. PSN259]|nr:hypothetical protein QBC43DRAFT_307975 [Cladorrhinum sp. PSN259]
MRLLNTSTLELCEFDISVAPRFAILSPTWGDDEITFDDMCGDRGAIEHRKGFQKIASFCQKAQESGFDHGWIDTCCIDKRSSAELSEAINSMYRYYAESAICFIHLADVELGGDQHVPDMVLNSRWFTRGWTLQELIAPSLRCVFDAAWTPITFTNMEEELAAAAKVPTKVLRDNSLVGSFCVAERMHWASKRQTTREEDIAYCLMGLFDIHMPTIYGEGGQKAFRRLQVEIMQTSFDQTLFAWRAPYDSSGLLARKPSDFRDTPELSIWGPRYLSPYSMTNVGLSVLVFDATIRNQDGAAPLEAPLMAMIQCDAHNPSTLQWQGLAIYLEPVAGAAFYVNGAERKAYRRVRCREWYLVPTQVSDSAPFWDVLVLEDEHHSLVLNARYADYSRFGRELPLRR